MFNRRGDFFFFLWVDQVVEEGGVLYIAAWIWIAVDSSSMEEQQRDQL